jgi:Uma2 family endonuclease
MTALTQTHPPKVIITWPLLPPDFPLPDDPVDNELHSPLAVALNQLLNLRPDLLEDALITTDFALCAGVNGKTICKGPDWMYVRPVKPSQKTRRSYTPHKQGSVPLIVMEFLSDTDGGEYSQDSQGTIGKWFFYEQVIRVPYYVIFEPEEGRLEVYHLEGQPDALAYRPAIPNAEGLYWIPEFQLFLGVWHGKHELYTCHWLRWWDAEGQPLPWPEERLAATQEHLAETQEHLAETQEHLAETQEHLAETQERLTATEAELQQTQRGAVSRLLAMGLTLEQVAEALALDLDRVRQIQETL